jgi:Macrocin-O-methyltransferase (TylF)
VITLPDVNRAFDYENAFYLSCDSTRMSKVLAHYELFKMTWDVPGAIVECGVFKGASLIRFAMFRELFGNTFSKKIVGFDTFGRFPDTEYEPDKKRRGEFVTAAGEDSISVEQLQLVLDRKHCGRHVELVAGDVRTTVPQYVRDYPELRISLLNLDTDVYEPAVTILEHLWPRLVKGGILIVDDYSTFPGETRAVDDYFQDRRAVIRKFPFCMTPCYILKEDGP